VISVCSGKMLYGNNKTEKLHNSLAVITTCLAKFHV